MQLASRWTRTYVVHCCSIISIIRNYAESTLKLIVITLKLSPFQNACTLWIRPRLSVVPWSVPTNNPNTRHLYCSPYEASQGVIPRLKWKPLSYVHSIYIVWFTSTFFKLNWTRSHLIFYIPNSLLLPYIYLGVVNDTEFQFTIQNLLKWLPQSGCDKTIWIQNYGF